MSYHVLARKWRPDSFESFMGQSHIVRALTNALDQERLHHAYLFTGTRGVGKTTLSRILTKCLNCKRGITSKPCNACNSCQEITRGSFIDLIEVDAASKTKVDSTREFLQSVPYAPAKARFKVYVLDEVHMLSIHSFNALLKTLEEPPAHVKFILATTDPQKIPITVLSRCLQFHLKSLSPEQITKRLAYILQQEKIDFEEEALMRLSYAAEGSMRDALSLLDQAIAFSAGQVKVSDVNLMLHTIDATYSYDIMDALASLQAEKLVAITQDLTEKSIDFSHALEELLSFIHQIAIAQFAANNAVRTWNKDRILQFAKRFSAQDIQLFYQIALIGRKDLPLAPTPRIGMEMVLLRMLAFQPNAIQIRVPSPPREVENPPCPTLPDDTKFQPETLALQTSEPTPVEPSVTEKPSITAFSQWHEILPHLHLKGITAVLGNHCALQKITDEEIILALDPKQNIWLNEKQKTRLAEALQDYFQRPLQLTIHIGKPNMNTPAFHEQEKQDQLKSMLKEAIEQDANVKKIIETFSARILPDSISSSRSFEQVAGSGTTT
jgi:DNA polymerase III subunit gamma/tau